MSGASLEDCHVRLRRGAFDRSLLLYMKAHTAEWASFEEEGDWLEGRAVASEIFDYFGDYQSADAALVRVDERFVAAVESPLDGSIELEKKRVWLTIALAHVRYRAEHYEKARVDLQGCLARLHRLDPDETQLFGTRSRLYYSLGQIARQAQQYDDALRYFSESCHHAEERFRRKTEFIELTRPPGQPFELTDEQRARLNDERLLAMWVVGKCLAFGIGWIEYVTGNLRAARTALSAGYSMLRGTEDWVHRAYAQMLLAACERAAAEDSADIEGILSKLKDSQGVLSAHPTFRGRAAFEMALTYLYANEPRRALEAIEKGVEHFTNAKAMATKTTRWKCDLLILKSRAHRLLRDEKAALSAAREALQKAELSDHVTVRINALMTVAEAATTFSANARNERLMLQRAHDDLSTALGLLRRRPNPKMQAACLLHLARVCHRLKDPVRAREAFEAWATHYSNIVQHGYLKRLANEIEDEIGRANSRFSVSSSAADISFSTNVANLKEFLIKAAEERAPGDRAAQGKMLGRSWRQIQRDAYKKGTR